VYRKILAGYDGSAAGRKAFDAALELAAKHGAELYVLAVARTSTCPTRSKPKP
jgi:nucleotide-binding universal stress UspA family protein